MRYQPATRVALWLTIGCLWASHGLAAQLSAGDLQLRIGASGSGIQLQRVRDARVDQEFLATKPLPLFSVTLHEDGSARESKLAADDGWQDVAVRRQGRGLELLWSRPKDEALADISVTATVRPHASANAFYWKLRIHNSNTNWSLWRVIFPQLNLADLGTNAAVLFPRGPGEVQQGIWGRAFRFSGDYPSGGCSMQFMAAYREGAQPTGLYMAVQDPWGGTKDMAVESQPAAHTTRFSFDHPAPNMGSPGNDFVLEGEAVWQLLRGDWYDAAQIYKRWARKHAKWWPDLTAAGRADTPSWMRHLNAWAMTGGAPADCVAAVKQLHDFLGVALGFHWYNWHQIPFDNDYPHYFPPKKGFTEGVAELKSAGVYVMPYINGRLWDSHDRGTQDFEFSRLALAAATKQPNGSPYLESYGSKETDGQPVRLAVMCPATALWQNTISNTVLRLLRECGTSAVYIDQVAAAPPKLCMDRRHGHPLGGGHWWNEGYWKMLTSIRNAMPRGAALTTECNAEPFIRWFDGYLTWNWQFQGQVPAFPAVYGGTIQMFGRAYRGGETKALALRMKAGQQLVFGEQLGWLDPGIVKEKESAEFFRQMVRLRAKFNRYFSAGEMARPPRLRGRIPTVRADWQWSGKWWVTTDAVLTGAWELPKQKRMVLLFVNVAKETVRAQLPFSAAANGMSARLLHVQRSTAEKSETSWENWPATFDRPITLAPCQGEAWELRW